MKERGNPFANQSITFQVRPVDVRADLRPSWLISVVVLILKACGWSGKSTRQKVHSLAWALLTPRTRTQFKAVLDGSAPPDSLTVRFDPSVNRAIDLASGFGLVTPIGGDRLELTADGAALADRIIGGSLFPMEIGFLTEIKRKVSEANVARVLHWKDVE
jgi:hypothetical protein